LCTCSLFVDGAILKRCSVSPAQIGWTPPTRATRFTVAGVLADEVHDQRKGRSSSAPKIAAAD
jgi:hypothetical protein